MSEQGIEFTETDVEDTEGHLMRVGIEGPEDDVEGHVQPPRENDTEPTHG